MPNNKAVTTPWGQATLIEEIEIPQDSPGKDFTSLVQLLEDDGGETLVRFVYATGGSARRGPVTLRAQDLETLRTGLRERGRLARALGLGRR
jgi:hypothetical protein